MPMRPIATACLLAGVTLLLYGFRLSSAPPSAPETTLLYQAQSGEGPVFFHVADDLWLPPVPVYATRLAGVIAPADMAARVATVVVAALDVALLFLCARLVFASEAAGVVAAVLLLLTPAHLLFGRAGSVAIFPLPFVLVSLLAFMKYSARDRAAAIAASGAALGAGIYTHRSAPLTMTFLLLVGLIALVASGRKWRSAFLFAASFVTLLVPAAVWFAVHPDTYPDTFGRWAIFLAHVRNPWDGVQAFLNWNTLGNRVSLYWGFFDPAWLFFGGPLLLPMLPLLILGLAGLRRAMSSDAMLLIAGGALVAPLAGSSFGEPQYISDALTVLPMAALLMAGGVVYCWKQDEARWRWAAAVLALAITLDSAAFVQQLHGFLR